MVNVSTANPSFLAILEQWTAAQPEILILIRYSHAAGNKEFEFFSSFQSLTARLNELPPRTSVIAFRQPQLPIRGVVDDKLIEQCMSRIPDHAEYLIVETVRQVYGSRSWYSYSAGETHFELRNDLEGSRGSPVAVGLYPSWLEDNKDIISAIVPDTNGMVKAGIY